MYKYNWKLIFILDGKEYHPDNGVLSLPKEYKGLNQYKITEEEKPTEKEQLIEEAHKLGIGSPSTLKRLSVETLKERIEEAK